MNSYRLVKPLPHLVHICRRLGTANDGGVADYKANVVRTCTTSYILTKHLEPGTWREEDRISFWLLHQTSKGGKIMS